MERQHVPQGVADFLPDLALREFYQLTLFQFEESGTNLVLEGADERPDEDSLCVSAVALVVAIHVQAYQDPEPPIPDVVERETASSADDIVGTQ